MGNSSDIREVASECLWVAEQEGVDKPKQLHHALILAQVFMTFQQELILLPVAACISYGTHTSQQIAKSYKC